MPVPLIAITTSELRKPGSSEVATPAHSHEPGGRRDLALALAYPGAVSRGGGAPVVVPPFAPEDDVEAILERVDGVVLSGGPDIHPCLYGEDEHPELGPVDIGLDRFELGFVRRALERDLPLLGICRGAELMNVARGGTLLQHIDGHRQAEEARVTTHDVRVEEGSRLAEILETTECAVNTYHHQAVDKLGGGVRAVAWAADGVVEGIELAGLDFAVGVQWHAEGLIDEPHQRALFASFVSAAQRYRSRAIRPRAA
ncbi:MAG TPA: gamma-glutamyl-gamma-aminobutyrate hydrolase family protein [Solirubrobacteraceae bacterium]|nr:gamma-glutamyl-gamma-aminobutyrate hydrolase family protein [Solirubrobacteraceae bacterium]